MNHVSLDIAFTWIIAYFSVICRPTRAVYIAPIYNVTTIERSTGGLYRN